MKRCTREGKYLRRAYNELIKFYSGIFLKESQVKIQKAVVEEWGKIKKNDDSKLINSVNDLKKTWKNLCYNCS